MNYSVNENFGPPKHCTFDIWPVTRKRLPTPDLKHVSGDRLRKEKRQSKVKQPSTLYMQ